MISLIRNEELSLLTDEPVIRAADVPYIQSLSEASRQLKQALDSLQARIEQAEKAGFKKGFEAGRAEGREKATTEVSERLILLAQQAAKHNGDLQNSVVQLAMQVVRKIAESVGAGEMVCAMAETAAGELLTEDALTIAVHPAVITRVQQRFDQLRTDLGDAAWSVEVRSDDSLQPYDCLLETCYGSTVASLDQQLAALEKVLQATADVSSSGSD